MRYTLMVLGLSGLVCRERGMLRKRITDCRDSAAKFQIKPSRVTFPLCASAREWSRAHASMARPGRTLPCTYGKFARLQPNAEGGLKCPSDRVYVADYQTSANQRLSVSQSAPAEAMRIHHARRVRA